MRRGWFIGREDELSSITRSLTRALSGTPSIVRIEGPPGIGKTALLHAALDRVAHAAPDSVIRRADCSPLEQVVEWGVGERLLATSAPDAPASFVEGGRMLREGLIGGGTPMILAIDDAQWCDRLSLEALSYTLPRLTDAPVLILLAHRSGELPALLDQTTRRAEAEAIVLAGLSITEIGALASAREVPLSEAAAARLHRHTAGDPQLTVALLTETSLDELRAGSGPIPAPGSFASFVATSFARCTAPARSLVSAAAVLGAAVSLPDLAFIAEAEGAGAVDEAIDAGLLMTGRDDTVSIAHALVRSAVLDLLPIARRSQLHARAAAVQRDPVRALLHRLHAATAYDEELATEAQAIAEECAGRGALHASALLLEQSARITADAAARRCALIRAAEQLLRIGEAHRAAQLLEQVPVDATALSPDPRELLVRGHLLMQLQEDPSATEQLLTAAWKEGRPEVRVSAAELLALQALDRADVAALHTWAERALTAAGADAVCDSAPVFLASSWALRGDPEAGRRELEDHGRRLAGTANLSRIAQSIALTHHWSGELDEAAPLVRALDPEAPGTSAIERTITRLARADVAFRLGDWDEALEICGSATPFAVHGWELRTAPMLLAVAAFIHAARGDEAALERTLGDIDALRGDADYATARIWGSIASAHRALAQGDMPGVVSVLAPLRASLEGIPLVDGYQPWRAMLAEALVRTGHGKEAAGVLDEAGEGSGADVRAPLLAARAALAAAQGDPDAAALFDAASALTAQAGPFARARVQLLHGGHTRRQGSRRKASALLSEAFEVFIRLGARPWAQEAEQQLRLSGAHRKSSSLLTPAQQEVARYAAQGLSNREIAEALTLSLKTVESHLGQIYRRLGIRRRAQLVSALATL